MRIILPLVFLLLACQNSLDRILSERQIVQRIESEHQYNFYTTSSAGNLNAYNYSNGELKESERGLLNTPCNTGFIPIAKDNQLFQIPALLIGDPVFSNTLEPIEIVAQCTYRENDLDKSYILCKPNGHELDFNTFLTIHDPLKSSIQHWIRFRNGIGSVAQLQWFDTQTATEFVEQQ